MFPVQGFRAFDGLSLDFKLGGRMLVRYPGLTVIAGLAMAFAICVGTVIFQMMSIFLYPSLPLPQGDRLVQIRIWDVAAKRAEPRQEIRQPFNGFLSLGHCGPGELQLFSIVHA